ncbi:unnamed protein product [Polarella glacialis]|uniref:Protein HIRA n=1 Tax=Polarella glacialis TaxID=89957 RepID=A0A813K0D3_POLGL|nr:unnamed protein product [Polarella glacialis]
MVEQLNQMCAFMGQAMTQERARHSSDVSLILRKVDKDLRETFRHVHQTFATLTDQTSRLAQEVETGRKQVSNVKDKHARAKQAIEAQARYVTIGMNMAIVSISVVLTILWVVLGQRSRGSCVSEHFRRKRSAMISPAALPPTQQRTNGKTKAALLIGKGSDVTAPPLLTLLQPLRGFVVTPPPLPTLLQPSSRCSPTLQALGTKDEAAQKSEANAPISSSEMNARIEGNHEDPMAHWKDAPLTRDGEPERRCSIVGISKSLRQRGELTTREREAAAFEKENIRRWLKNCQASKPILKLATEQVQKNLIEIAHGGEAVNEVALAADGRLASAGDDGTVVLWNAEGGQIQRLEGVHGKLAVTCVDFSPDGILASAGEDGSIVLWTTAGKEWCRSKNAHRGAPVITVAFADPNWLTSAGQDGSLVLWHIKGNKMVRDIEEKHALEAVDDAELEKAMDLKQQVIAIVKGAKADAENIQQLRCLFVSQIFSVAANDSSDDSPTSTGPRRRPSRRVSGSQALPLGQDSGVQNSALQMRIGVRATVTPDAKVHCTLSTGFVVSSPPMPTLLQRPYSRGSYCNAEMFKVRMPATTLKEKKPTAQGGDTKAIQQRQPTTAEGSRRSSNSNSVPLQTNRRCNDAGGQVTAAAQRSSMSGAIPPELSAVNVRTGGKQGRALGAGDSPSSRTTATVLAEVGVVRLEGSGGPQVNSVDHSESLEQGVLQRWLKNSRGSMPPQSWGTTLEGITLIRIAHGGETVNEVALAADGRMASAGDDGAIVLWNAEGGQILRLEGLHGGLAVTAVDFSPDGLLASAGDDGSIVIWTTVGNLVKEWCSSKKAHGGAPIYAVAFAAPQWLTSAGQDGSLVLWHIKENEMERDIEQKLAIEAAGSSDDEVEGGLKQQIKSIIEGARTDLTILEGLHCLARLRNCKVRATHAPGHMLQEAAQITDLFEWHKEHRPKHGANDDDFDDCSSDSSSGLSEWTSPPSPFKHPEQNVGLKHYRRASQPLAGVPQRDMIGSHPRSSLSGGSGPASSRQNKNVTMRRSST